MLDGYGPVALMSLRGHPPGAYFLAFIEALERFGYYGMRGLLVLFLTAGTAAGGLGWSEQQALSFYGWYTAAVWLTPLAGGWLADRFLDARVCVLAGGWVICAGMVMLWAASAGQFGGLAPGTGDASTVFLGGLVLVAVGTGLLKGNITVMLGRLYSPQDPRRDSAFTLYYVAINLGVILSALVAGTAGERLGWSAGFAVCAGVITACMVLYTALQGRLVRLMPEDGGPRSADSPAAQDVGRRAGFVLALTAFAAIFFAAYEQGGGFVNLLVFQKVERTVFGFEVPATWFLASTGVFCILLGPMVAALLQRRGSPVDAPTRFALGLALAGAAFGVLWIGIVLSGDGRIGIQWPISFFLVLTLAELALAPAGFGMVTRYAPTGSAGTFMGLWFLALALGSVLGGQLAARATAWSDSVLAGLLAIVLGLAAAVLFRGRSRLLRLVAGC